MPSKWGVSSSTRGPCGRGMNRFRRSSAGSWRHARHVQLGRRESVNDVACALVAPWFSEHLVGRMTVCYDARFEPVGVPTIPDHSSQGSVLAELVREPCCPVCRLLSETRASVELRRERSQQP
jgi:hypothetical protein